LSDKTEEQRDRKIKISSLIAIWVDSMDWL